MHLRTNASISSCGKNVLKIWFATAPPATRPIVSRAEARPPPCQLRMPYFRLVRVVRMRRPVQRLHLLVRLRALVLILHPDRNRRPQRPAPSNVPDKIWQVSDSFRRRHDLAFPGRRRSKSICTSASVSATRAGHPSTTTPTPAAMGFPPSRDPEKDGQKCRHKARA